MRELGFKTFETVPINSDSTGVLSIAGNSMYSARTKHTALCYFYLREVVKRGRVAIHHKSIKLHLADVGTKHLTKSQFTFLIKAIQDFQC